MSADLASKDIVTVVIKQKSDEKLYSLDLPIETSVRSLRILASDALCVPIDDFLLVFQGVVLEDGHPMKMYGIGENSVVNAVQKRVSEPEEESTDTQSSEDSSDKDKSVIPSILDIDDDHTGPNSVNTEEQRSQIDKKEENNQPEPTQEPAEPQHPQETAPIISDERLKLAEALSKINKSLANLAQQVSQAQINNRSNDVTVKPNPPIMASLINTSKAEVAMQYPNITGTRRNATNDFNFFTFGQNNNNPLSDLSNLFSNMMSQFNNQDEDDSDSDEIYPGFS